MLTPRYDFSPRFKCRRQRPTFGSTAPATSGVETAQSEDVLAHAKGRQNPAIVRVMGVSRDLPGGVSVAPPLRATFWSGAGISADAPTQGPVGPILTERALNQAFDGPVVLERLAKAYDELRIEDAGRTRRLPRLETVLDVAVTEHGIDVLAGLLGDLRSPPHNAQHKFFAEHVLAGGRHVTANFDTCIEQAGGDPSRIVHIHGVVDRWEAMGARLSVIETGLPARLQNQLRGIISNSDLLVIVGYSGLDYFDVDPFWRACNGERLLEGKVVLWVEHEGSGWAFGEDLSRPHAQLKGFVAGGAELYVIRAPTRDVLSELAANWSLPPLERPPPLEARSEVELGLSSQARERATTRLFSVMGLNDTVRERLAGRTLRSRGTRNGRLRPHGQPAGTANQLHTGLRPGLMVMPRVQPFGRSAMLRLCG